MPAEIVTMDVPGQLTQAFKHPSAKACPGHAGGVDRQEGQALGRLGQETPEKQGSCLTRTGRAETWPRHCLSYSVQGVAGNRLGR